MDIQITIGQKDGETTACQPVCVEMCLRTEMELLNSFGELHISASTPDTTCSILTSTSNILGTVPKLEFLQTQMQDKQQPPRMVLLMNLLIHQQLKYNLHQLPFQFQVLMYLLWEARQKSARAMARQLLVIMVSASSSLCTMHTTFHILNSNFCWQCQLCSKHLGNGM